MNRVHIFEDDWCGAKSNNSAYFSESLNEMLDVVRKLNGQNKTSVVFVLGACSLTVSGGNHGRYICLINQNGDADLCTLRNTNEYNETEMVEVVAGGQVGVFSMKMVVSRDLIEQALRYFAKSGQPDPSLFWEHEVA